MAAPDRPYPPEPKPVSIYDRLQSIENQLSELRDAMCLRGNQENKLFAAIADINSRIGSL